jgi:hypothetical protein
MLFQSLTKINHRLYSPSLPLPPSAGPPLSFLRPLSFFLQVRQTYSSSDAMGENWFQREFLTPRRLAFNVFFYGSQLFFFILGWYLQVRL